jgi:hypothetical protein
MSSLPSIPGFYEFIIVRSPIGLWLIDDFAAKPPMGHVSAELQQPDPEKSTPANFVWINTGIKPVVTPHGLITFPKLGRTARPADAMARTYRIVLSADYYRPLYPPGKDGYEFQVFPYNDTHPPAQLPQGMMQAFVLPSANYPFSSEVMVLRGQVVDSADNAVTDAEVNIHQQTTTAHKVLTDERGAFALPLRRVARNAMIEIDAADRSNRQGSLQVHLPDDLGRNLTIPIS